MSDFSDLVDEDKNLLLKNLSAICEVSDVAKAVDSLDSLAWEHRIQVTARVHVLGDNCGTGLSETESQQVGDLRDGLLQNCCLKRSVLLNRFLLLSLVEQPVLAYVPVHHFKHL